MIVLFIIMGLLTAYALFAFCLTVYTICRFITIIHCSGTYKDQEMLDASYIILFVCIGIFFSFVFLLTTLL